MPDLEKIMSVASADIEKIMGVARADIEKVMGVTMPSLSDWKGSRAIIFGGNYYTAAGQGRSADTTQYKTLTTDGNTTVSADLADLNHSAAGSGSNGVRIVYAGGTKYWSGTNTGNHTEIQYMVAASTGSVGEAGDLNVGSDAGGRDGSSNGTLCFFVGGNGLQANMEQMNISTTSGSTNAGDIDGGATANAMTSNGDSKFLIMGIGTSGGRTAVDQHNFSTSADSSGYGSVATVDIGAGGAVCATNRVVCAGNAAHSTRMHFFPVASSADSDSSDSADLITAATGQCATSDGTRGEWYGGDISGGGMKSDIQKVTIASLSNATDIGDLQTPESATDRWTDSDPYGIVYASAQTGILA